MPAETPIERVAEFLDVWEHERGADSVVRGGNYDIPYLMTGDLRAVLELARQAERLRAERDALEAELPPRCTSCGERYRDGCHSEWDNSWMCSRCYVDAASARLRAPEPVGDLPPVDGGEPT